MNSNTIDASLVVSVVPEEERGQKVRGLISTQNFSVPSLLYIEAANVITTKTNFPENKIEEAMRLIYEIGFETIELSTNQLIESAKLTKKICCDSLRHALRAIGKITKQRTFHCRQKV